MNKDKRSPPDRLHACIGIGHDLGNNSLIIDKTKLEEIYGIPFQLRAKSKP